MSINNCESVIRSVLHHLAGIDIGRLLQKTTAASLMVESETLAKMQGSSSKSLLYVTFRHKRSFK